ncbi:MAG: DUF4402 domain-containing protein [Bacteroidales bacterium]
MRRLRKIFFGLAVLLFTTAAVTKAQVGSVSATGHIIAEIIPVFSASETSQMNFGRFSPGPQGGEIVLTPQNTVMVLGSVYAGTGLHSAASFYLTGDSEAAFSVSLPTTPVYLTHTRSARTMRVDDWISVPAHGVGTGVLQNGVQVVYVGATLKIGTLNDNPVGVYTGTYNITFDFN